MLLLGLDEWQPRLVQSDIIFLLEILIYTHIGGLAGRFFNHVEFVFFGVELGDLLHSPDFGF